MSKFSGQLEEVNGYKEEVEKLSQEQIREEITNYKLQITKLETEKEILEELEEIAPRVFALTREAAKRSIGQFHYDVQVAGGFALADGKIAEMKTGEGKTLTATLPLALYALARAKARTWLRLTITLARWQASLYGPGL